MFLKGKLYKMEQIDVSKKNQTIAIRVEEVLVKNKFVIPLYQRSYDWSYDEILQLLLDIKKLDSSGEYYLGNFIVQKLSNNKDELIDKYELIDGQQRLTTLYLIALMLKKIFKDSKEIKNPEFKSRNKSNKTFEYLKKLDNSCHVKNKDNNFDDNIINAYNIICDFLKTPENEVLSKDCQFVKNFFRCKIFLIEVPEHTDLNRYFETMNSRGIQLRQVDLVKFMLLRKLTDSKIKKRFNSIWNACSNMNGYFQNHLNAKNNGSDKSDREFVFGGNWDYLLSFHKENNDGPKPDNEQARVFSLQDIVKPNSYIGGIEDFDTKENDDQHKTRYQTIISFEYFLIYVLYIFCKKYKLNYEEITFDDKKLKSNYEKINWKNKSVKDFFYTLALLRFIFDKFVIKRNEISDEGKWTLFYLKKNEDKFEPQKYNNDKSDLFVKIQSCLRVTYPYCSKDDWLSVLLEHIYGKFSEKIDNSSFDIENSFDDLTSQLENIAKQKVKNLLTYSKENPFCKGTSTPRILFNYLDYLIYKSLKNNKSCEKLLGITKITFDDFSFEYRNSVEHWHPQNPEQNDYKRDQCYLDNFGNLTLVTTGQNSRFSNFMPEDKKKYLSEKSANYSLKLRIMQQLTNNKDKWMNENGEGLYKDHYSKMINLLLNDIGPICIGQSCELCMKISVVK